MVVLKTALATLGLALALQAQDLLCRARDKLPMSLPHLCREGIDYLKERDTRRALRVLELFDDYTRQFDRRWKCDLRALVQAAKSSAKKTPNAQVDRSKLLRAYFRIALADLTDHLRVIEADAKASIRAARYRLLSAKADFAIMSDYIKLTEKGRKLHAFIQRRWLDMAARIPRARRAADGWQASLRKDARRVLDRLDPVRASLASKGAAKERKRTGEKDKRQEKSK